jgi:hypothetical protein
MLPETPLTPGSLESGPEQTPDSAPQPENATQAGLPGDHPTCPACRRVYQPGELVCSHCGIVFQNKLTTKPREAPESLLLICTGCGTPYQPNILACPSCGLVFNAHLSGASGETKHFTPALTEAGPSAPGQVEEVPVTDMTVILDDGHHYLVLPMAEEVIVGRAGATQEDQLLMDLGSFDAYELGVSRRHLSIKRRETLIYVADLGSSNGTWLNGQRLLPYAEHLLLSQDVLQLSQLRLHVLYSLENL